MAGLLDFLLQDQNTGSQGLLGQLLNGPNGAGTQPVIPPGTPSPGYSAGPAQNYFRPRTGLLGDSILGDALRGGLAGLAGSTGYKGFGAQLGAGALSAEQNMQQRRQQQQGSLLGGQQYQSGQQSLIGGNIGNIFAFQKVNAMLRDMGQPEITMDQLNQHPELVSQAMSYSPGRQPLPTPQGAGTAAPIVPNGPGGMNGSPAVNQAMGTSAAPYPGGSQGQPPSTPAAPSDAVFGSPGYQPTDAYHAGKLQELNEAWFANDAFGTRAKIMGEVADHDAAPGQAAAVTTATGTATQNLPQTTSNNIKDFAAAFQNEPNIKVIQELAPVKATIDLAAQGTTPVSDADLINSTIRIWNPGAASVRPGMVSTIGDIQNIQGLGDRAIAALTGGGKLTDADRAYLVQSAQRHFNAYKIAAAATLQGYRTRAKFLPRPAGGGDIPESAWAGGVAGTSGPSVPPTVTNAADYAALPSGTVYIDPNGNKRTKQ